MSRAPGRGEGGGRAEDPGRQPEEAGVRRPGPPEGPGESVSAELFHQLEIRAGIVRRAEPFPEARKPSIRLWVDVGKPWGEIASSAQLTRRHLPADLIGRTVLVVVNLPPRRIAGFRSDGLVLGLVNPDDPGDVVLVQPADPGSFRGWRLG